MVVFGNDTKKLYAGVFQCKLNLAKAYCVLVQTFFVCSAVSRHED